MGTTTGHNKLGPLTDAAADELTDHCQYQISFGQVVQSYNDTQWGLIVIEKNYCQAQGCDQSLSMRLFVHFHLGSSVALISKICKIKTNIACQFFSNRDDVYLQVLWCKCQESINTSEEAYGGKI